MLRSTRRLRRIWGRICGLANSRSLLPLSVAWPAVGTRARTTDSQQRPSTKRWCSTCSRASKLLYGSEKHGSKVKVFRSRDKPRGGSEVEQAVLLS
jgi:hypothetical protein